MNKFIPLQNYTKCIFVLTIVVIYLFVCIVFIVVINKVFSLLIYFSVCVSFVLFLKTFHSYHEIIYSNQRRAYV